MLYFFKIKIIVFSLILIEALCLSVVQCDTGWSMQINSLKENHLSSIIYSKNFNLSIINKGIYIENYFLSKIKHITSFKNEYRSTSIKNSWNRISTDQDRKINLDIDFKGIISFLTLMNRNSWYHLIYDDQFNCSNKYKFSNITIKKIQNKVPALIGISLKVKW